MQVDDHRQPQQEMIDGQPCLGVITNPSRQGSRRRENKDLDIVLSWSLYDGGLVR
jgi:hypothetical protein